MLPFDFAHAVKVLGKRKHARESLWEFANQTMLRRLPSRVSAPHHQVLCHRLQQFIESPDDGIMIVLMPPGAGKSMFAAQALPAWYMGRRPGARVALVTNSLPLAERSGRAIRDLVSSRPYDLSFEGVGLTTGSTAVGAFSLTNGSEFLGIGVGGALLGRRCELVVIDDPISGFAEAQSETQLTKLHEHYKSTILSRLTPGAKVVLIQQRLARNDLAGYIMDTAAVTSEDGGRSLAVLKMPMLCTDPENDPLGRAEGEPLWPDYYTRGMLVDAQADEFIWKTLYQQQPPTDEGIWCSTDDIQWGTAPDDIMGGGYLRYVCCDLALSSGSGDYTVFAVVAVHQRSGHMYLVDMYRARENPGVTADALVDLCRAYKPHEVLIEDDPAFKSWRYLPTETAHRNGVPINIRVMPIAGKNKEQRAAGLAGLIKRKRLHLDASKHWTRHVVRELLAFPNAMGTGVDDIVDALGTLGRRLPAMVITKPGDADGKRVDYPLVQDGMCIDHLFEDNEAGMGKGKRI